MPVEHTLALITPEGMPHAKKIIFRIKKESFTILARRTVHLTPEQVSDFYHHLYGQRDFPLLVASTSVAPVTALCLGRHHAVEKLVQVVGPRDIAVAKRDALGSLNAQYGSVECNLAAVHASADPKAARREILFFFPQSQVEPWTELGEGLRWLEEHVGPLLKEGLAQMLKEKPVEPMLWLADWLLQNNPNQPQVEQHLRHHPLSKPPKY
uniref:Nucleoside diphosphate kinase-like domain-containing protein n=1 Tax=Cuerna arida TaxID=1464854 RepID=A0A1B6FHX8_9HEMI